MIDVLAIKRANPVEEVIARYISLRKSGRTLRGLCPFHNDTDPSLVVWPETGTWHCFGCGRGGDVIDFLREVEGISFLDACKKLEGNLPSQLPSPRPAPSAPPSPSRISPEILFALGVAQRVYHARLLTLPPEHNAWGYLRRRGIRLETIRRFGIGWCSGNDLQAAGSLLAISMERFLQAGLVLPSSWREFFRKRIVIPEISPGGTVIHMVGRAISERQIRFLSLPHLPRPLYGLMAVKRQQPVAVVEGIFCRMSLEQHGVQSVAVMGTSLGGWAEDLRTIPDLWFIPQNDGIAADKPPAQEWLLKVRGIEGAERWIQQLIRRQGNCQLTRGQVACLEWILEVGHGQIVDLPPGVKDVNDLEQAGGLEEWLDTWAPWRKLEEG